MPDHTLPTLQTERLVLRPWALADFDEYFAMWQDPAVAHFITGEPLSREDCWRRMLGSVGQWHLMGFGFFVVREKSSGSFVGAAGFHEMRRALTPSIEGTLEAGWALASAHHGKGYAREAMRASIDWALQAFPTQEITCIIDPENHASLRLAEALGFARETVATYKNEPTVIFRMGQVG